MEEDTSIIFNPFKSFVHPHYKYKILLNEIKDYENYMMGHPGNCFKNQNSLTLFSTQNGEKLFVE